MLNTIHFAVQIIETGGGVVIAVSHRNGELIDIQAFWNDDVTDTEN